MKLLKISAKGFDLFKEEIEIDFYASQRVSECDSNSVNEVFGNVFTNNIISFVGINASGKTSTLKLILFVLDLLNAEPISNIRYVDILKDSEKVKLEIFFYDDVEYVYKLYTEIALDTKNEDKKEYVITHEKMWRKKALKSMLKKDLFTFDEEAYLIRDNRAEFLKRDISIAISVNKARNINYYELINKTDINVLDNFGVFPPELLNFLDPSIESLRFGNNNDVYLKFHHKTEIHLNNIAQLEKFFSSGTIKGLNIFVRAIRVFIEGGYLIVDELENHFNMEIVVTLIRFFMNEDINKRGACLLFTTHYPELLDEFDRNDSIYIIRNENGIYLEKLSEKLKRNDVKKSDVFKSDYLGGTAPTYRSYIALKRNLISIIPNHGGQ